MKQAIRSQLITLSHLSGLDNTERLLVSRFLAKRWLDGRDSACVRAMVERHLVRRRGQTMSSPLAKPPP